jgi:hypothetical protein
MQVPAILSIEEMMKVWRLVDKQEIDDDAEDFIQAIVREFSVCDRINKGVSSEKEVGPDLCADCHLNTTKVICNKVTTILSVRAAKDLQRYTKALAWLMGTPADIYLVMTIAPYVIQHRVKYVGTEIAQGPYFGDKMRFTRALLGIVRDRFMLRKEAMDIIKDIKKGSIPNDAIDILEAYAKNDLVVKADFLPLARVYIDARYRGYVKRIEDAYDARNVNKLLDMKRDLYNDTEILHKGELLTTIGIHLQELTKDSYTFPFSKWRDQIWADIAAEFAPLQAELFKSLSSMMRKQLRTKDSIIELIVTGLMDDSEVSLDISGGNDALLIKDILVRAGVYHEGDLHVPRKRD